ncbi:hypothetical protein PR048_027789 [Dryococelus australis]|uniref:Helitron helicase-like domain-containing protein n=1 Tax=Dryococelus australis TaxID=614101 RepID=A0ABQ9GHH2_9NEOP|nr:hypothetical protein PR048_027789 [Dryococelus australis]
MKRKEEYGTDTGLCCPPAKLAKELQPWPRTQPKEFHCRRCFSLNKSNISLQHRYMHGRTQEAFCYVRKYGRPDLFITFTTNPKWNEITCGINFCGTISRQQLPDVVEDQELFKIVKQHMVHDPCGALNPQTSSMKDGVCSKNFQNNFQQKLLPVKMGVHFKGLSLPKKVVGKQRSAHLTVPLKLTDILSRTSKAHIIAKICSSIKSISKYVNKGPDLAVFGVRNQND